MPSFVVPTTTASQLFAQAQTLLSDPGTLAIILVAIGVPFGFWFIHKLIGLVPKKHGSR